MTRDDRFIDQLEDYLDSLDGDTPLPGHVRNAIHAELPRTRQVRPRRGPARILTIMSNAPSRAPWAIAAAAVVVAIVGGAWFLSGGQSDVGVAPTPVPTAAPTPSPATSATPVASAAGVRLSSAAAAAPCRPGGDDDCIAAGTYAFDVPFSGQQVVVDVPEGWFPYFPSSGLQALLVDMADAGGGSGWGLALLRIGEVFKDTCDPASGTFAATEVDTPEGLATAMGQWPGFTVSTPEPATFAGLDGIAVTVAATKSTADCPGASIWRDPNGSFVDAYPMIDAGDTGQPAEFRIFDAGDELLVVRVQATTATSPYEVEQGLAPDPERHAANLVTRGEILESARLEPLAP